MFGIRVEKGGLIVDSALPCPMMKPHEVMIEVAYSGVNRADLLQMKGHYPPPEGASELLGLEVSGTITHIGSNVTGFNVGDEVCALLEGGGYAEEVCVAASQCLPIPKGWSLAEAAILPEALFTNWLALFHTAKIQPDETLLLHGGASGISAFGTQMAKAHGCKVITTAGTGSKCKFSLSQGADQSYLYPKVDFFNEIKKDYGAVNVILDMVGGDYFQKNLSLLKPYGRLIQIAFLSSAKANLNMAPLIMNQLSWHGLTLRARSQAQKAQLAQEIRQNCWHLLESRTLMPVCDEEFALKDAALAVKKMEQNLNLGKIRLKA